MPAARFCVRLSIYCLSCLLRCCFSFRWAAICLLGYICTPTCSMFFCERFLWSVMRCLMWVSCILLCTLQRQLQHATCRLLLIHLHSYWLSCCC